MADPGSSLKAVLSEAKELGLLGPASIDDQVEHSKAFVDLVAKHTEQRRVRSTQSRPAVVDLGSGGGIPGLVIAALLPSIDVTLLDGSSRRTEWLAWAVVQLELEDHVSVKCLRAEEYGRLPERRSTFDVVTARAFGPPAVAAECAAPLLRTGGRLLVSEPPQAQPNVASSRWPEEGLREFGFAPAVEVVARGKQFVEIELVEECPDRFPRRVGIPEKRPRF